jgi:crossover junction endodeoxyribonuclease RuvC
VSFGVIRTDPGLALPERLGRLHHELEALIAELRPSAVAVERVLFQVNVRTAMSVGQASGLALALAARAGVPVAQYSPNEVKLAVAGYGNAEKAAVQTMVVRLLDLPGPPGSPDASDALALALCHTWGAKLHPTREAARRPNRGYEQAVAAALAKDAGSR